MHCCAGAMCAEACISPTADNAHANMCSCAGYDACAHMSEETKGAGVNSAVAIMLVIWISGLAGICYLIALLFSIQVSSIVRHCFM